MNTVSKTARKEIVEALRVRHGRATKFEKGVGGSSKGEILERVIPQDFRPDIFG